MMPLLEHARGDVLTPEMRMWWQHLPDFRIVISFECHAPEWGFAQYDPYAGTTAKGNRSQPARVGLRLDRRKRCYHPLGLVRRFRRMVPFLDLIGLQPRGLTYQRYLENFLDVGTRT
jgi:hypothetical protein